MNATETKIIPLISSGTAGPLGVLHLPRLWLKLTLGAHGMLADGYDMCGQGFDQMTLTALGLDKDKTLAFVRDQHPTYVQFEEYVVRESGGSVAPDTISKHNAAITGYDHADDLGQRMRSESGFGNATVRDAVTLNMLEDLHEMHAQIERSH